jgi:hypothetical protein
MASDQQNKTPLRNPHSLLDRNPSREIATFAQAGVHLCSCVSFNLSALEVLVLSCRWAQSLYLQA